MAGKIIVLTSEFPPHPGGIGNHAHHVASHLTRHGYPVTVIAPSDDEIPDVEAFDKQQAFTIIRIGGSLPVRVLRLLGALRKEAATQSIVLATGRSSLILAGLAPLFIPSGVPVIAMAHGLDINSTSPLIRSFVNLGLDSTSKIIAVSRYTGSLLKPDHQSKMVVINNGFDEDGFQPVERTVTTGSKSPHLITVGSISFRKGQINVIRALPELIRRFKTIHYTMVGFPVDVDAVVDEAKKLGVSDYIELTGVLEPAQMKKALGQADIFVMLSDKTPDGDFEGFGIAIVEANASGLPAIGSKDCGIEDAIRPGQSGILVDPHDPMTITHAIETVMADAQGFRRRAIEHAAHFHWTTVIAQYIKVFNDLRPS